MPLHNCYAMTGFPISFYFLIIQNEFEKKVDPYKLLTLICIHLHELNYHMMLICYLRNWESYNQKILSQN